MDRVGDVLVVRPLVRAVEGEHVSVENETVQVAFARHGRAHRRNLARTVSYARNRRWIIRVVDVAVERRRANVSHLRRVHKVEQLRGVQTFVNNLATILTYAVCVRDRSNTDRLAVLSYDLVDICAVTRTACVEPVGVTSPRQLVRVFNRLVARYRGMPSLQC